MSASQELPTKEELKRQQLYLANEKLKLETDALRCDATPNKWWGNWAKNIIAVGGIATVIATLFGVWDSYNKTIIDRERTRVADQRTRFEDAIKRLESSETISKLVGVSVLSGYLTGDYKEAHRQILFTLASLMATEKNVQTQAAVIDLITERSRSKAIGASDWIYFHQILISQSRALMTEGNLAKRRHAFFPAIRTSDVEQPAQTLAALIAADVRAGVVPNYTDYKGIFCSGCDFNGVVFPAKVDFTGAILDRANFNGSSWKRVGKSWSFFAQI
jgi:hypothetical protein